jgi:tetratricopeptide (TPR) repeat protein
MRWLQTEYVLKGIYLGLVLYAALQQAAIPPDNSTLVLRCLAEVNLLALAGLALGLLVAGLVKLREGFRVRGRLIPFLLFLLLESPTLAYLGILGGTVAGIFLVRNDLTVLYPASQDTLQQLLVPVLGGAALAGLVFGLLRQVRDRMVRLGVILAAGALVVALAMSWLGLRDFGVFGKVGKPYELVNPTAFAVQLLLGIPFFYLLTFAGHEEESEVEIGAICATLGVGLGILLQDSVQFGTLAVILPLFLYFGYTWRVLPGLRVLKHAFRGYSYTRVGRHRRALQAFRRALQLDPNNRLARDGFWEVHRSLDLNTLANDAPTLALVDLDLCLERAGSLLIHGKPTPAQLEEAHRLLDLVLSVQPDHRPPVDYWRAVAHTHSRDYEQACTELEHLLDPGHYGPDNPQRLGVLMPAWQLSLMLHDELRRRVGLPQLAQPGRRMEAIAAVERYLAEHPDDPSPQALKRLLYQDLTEEEYNAFAGEGGVAAHFDYPYVQQLGLALIDDDTRWQRGGEYLRLAARGQPTLGPTIFVQIAQAHQRAGHAEDARHNYELAKRAGQAVGPKNLADAERHTYFATVKLLGESAMARGDIDSAIENFRLYSESERSGLETLRTLAELYERKGDALAALRVTDQALIYNPRDRDLLERKDKYYYSVMPEQLAAAPEPVRGGFDFDYCLTKARSILDARYTDMDWLDVADHLTQLALVIHPDSQAARVLRARVDLRLGKRDEALGLLEGVRSPKPEKFASGADEEAWYLSCQLLGDLYLEVGRPELAIPCFHDFRKSSKSGAKTWLKLGQAYEQTGDRTRAIKCYQQVTAYDGNPLAPDAYEALQRLQG